MASRVHFSGKHDWSRTCYVPDATSVPEHVADLVTVSEMFALASELPYRVWFVRELLPVAPVAVLSEHGDIPLVKEVRAFVRDGHVFCAPVLAARCHRTRVWWSARADPGARGHPPRSADEQEWRSLAERVAAAFAGDGAWSVDFLATRRGWFVTDMAEAARSFHFDGCEHARTL